MVAKRLSLAAIFAAALGGLVALPIMSEILAKPARPGAPSWRTLTAARNAPPPSIPRQKKPATPSGWHAATEADTTASVDPAAGSVPLPEKNPFRQTAASSTPAPDPATVPQKTSGRLASANRLSPEAPLSPVDVVTTEVVGEDDKNNDKDKNQEKGEQPPVAAHIGEGAASKQYCSNISTAAADARFAWQKKALLQTEQEVARRVAELDQKIDEYQKWLARRDEFSRLAEATVVGIYAKMKPDAAAQQLTVIDEEIAAAVLTKLDPKTASAVMNEMDPKRGARLTAIITGAARGPGGKPPAAQPHPTTSKEKGS